MYIQYDCFITNTVRGKLFRALIFVCVFLRVCRYTCVCECVFIIVDSLSNSKVVLEVRSKGIINLFIKDSWIIHS